MRLHWGILVPVLCSAALSVGCKKKEGAVAPTASRPGIVLPSVEQFPAAAEVSASSGAVQLILRIHQTRISEHHSLYYQIELKNIGSEALPVVDEAFWDPWAQGRYRAGVDIEVIGPGGKAPRKAKLPPLLSFSRDPREMRALPDPDTKEGVQFRKKLERMSHLERSMAVSDYLRRAQAKQESAETPNGFLLAPGTSTSTVAWVLQDELAIMEGKPFRQPVGKYTELVVFDFSPSGKYRIRAVYDYRPSGWLIKHSRDHRIHPRPEQVMVATPFVELEVAP